MDERLIYVPSNGENRWHSVDQCLWSGATQVQGRVSLNDLYPNFEEFFVDFLEVQELTLQMAYDELKEKGTRDPPPSIMEVKETIWALNALIQDTQGVDNLDLPDPKPLCKSKIFPVKYRGKTRLRTLSTHFAIIDRQALGDIFSPNARLLDFTLDEVRQLKYFLGWLKIDFRYLSSMVREITTVFEAEKTRLRDPDRNVKSKAQALLRYVEFFVTSVCCFRVHIATGQIEDI